MTFVLRTARPIHDVLPLGVQLLVQHDDAARIYEVATGALVRELATGPLGHFERSLAVSPDGRHVIATTATKLVRFDMHTWELVDRVIVLQGTGAAFTADGRVVLLRRLDNHDVVLSVWTPGGDRPTVLARFGQHHNAKGVTIAADGKHVWVSLSTFFARVALEDGAMWTSPRIETCLGMPVSLAGRVAIGTLDGNVQIWSDDTEPTLEAELRVGPETLHEVHLAALRGTHLAATAADQRISIFAPGDLQPRVRLDGPRGHLGVLAADGDTLWAAVNTAVWRYDLTDADFEPPAKARKAKATYPLTNHPTPHVLALAVATPGIAVSTDLDGGICSWRRGTDDAVAYRKPKPDPTSSSRFAISHIAVIGSNIVVREGPVAFLVLDAATLRQVAKLPHREAATAVTDGTTLITTGGKVARAYRVEGWEQLAVRDNLSPDTHGVEWIAASRAITFVDTRGCIGLISVDDLKTKMSRSFADAKEPGDPVANHEGTHLAFRFAEGRASRVRILELATGKVTTLAEDVGSPSFLGSELVVASLGRVAWYSLDGVLQREHQLRRARLAAVREDAIVMTVDDQVVVLDPTTGTPRTSVTVAGGVWSVRFDGNAIVVGTDGGRVVWHDL